jgi:Uma2 family endonuclease
LTCSQTTKAALTWPGTLGYQCFPEDSNKVRRPDVSAVRTERFSAELFKDAYLTIRPDLAVEVVSPNDTAYEVAEKVEEYLRVNVPLVWVFYPEARKVEIHLLDGSVKKLYADAEITGGDILPGFRCRVSSFFPPA